MPIRFSNSRSNLLRAMDTEAGITSNAYGSSSTASSASWDCFLAFCRLINVATGLSLVLCAVSCAMALVVGGPFTEPGAETQALRLFGMVFAVVMALVETEWQFIMTWFKFAENWIARGFVQAFVAVLTMEVATSRGHDDFHKSIVIYRVVATTGMLCCAGFYMFGGLFCFGLLKEVRSRRERELRRVQADLETLEKQREQLQVLLAGYVK